MNTDAKTPSEDVTITLSKPKALVLFDFLSRFSDEGILAIQDQAEQRVLWEMCCDLERVLVEPFQADYDSLLQTAREVVRDEHGQL